MNGTLETDELIPLWSGFGAAPQDGSHLTKDQSGITLTSPKRVAQSVDEAPKVGTHHSKQIARGTCAD